MRELVLRPRGPYSMQLSTRLAADATRRVEDGALTAVLPGGEIGRAWQLPDGSVVVRASSAEGVETLRFVLALDDDHTEFLRRFATDPMLGRATRELRGLRPTRVPTVAQALLRAFCGQLITSKGARAIEREVVRTATPRRTDGLHAPPTGADLARFSAAELRACGLHARRGAALLRVLRELDVESLRRRRIDGVRARLLRERGVGPWSLGVVCLQGLGRYDQGLVGDLGLIKLLRALRGREVDAAETAELLEPYGEWAGLASVYLLAAWGRGLLPVRPVKSADGRGAEGRDPGRRQDRRVAARWAAQRGLARA
jgi:AraC family transcriptional regulator, regulatory protein of adaptative response / DNA-3-methyladenine glycosylase II